LAADYNADPVFNKDELCLITHVVNITGIFSANFQLGTHSRYFEKSSIASDTDKDFNLEEPPRVESIIDNLRVLLEKARVNNIALGKLAELGNIIVPLLPYKILIPRKDFSAWINNVYLKSRGLDLGIFNANFITMAFVE
jgi:hypothetical protein